MTDRNKKLVGNGRVSPNNPDVGKFFGLFSLVGETQGVLSIFIRLHGEKHYVLYERRAFVTAAQAGRYLTGIEPGAQMFVIDPSFE